MLCADCQDDMSECSFARCALFCPLQRSADLRLAADCARRPASSAWIGQPPARPCGGALLLAGGAVSDEGPGSARRAAGLSVLCDGDRLARPADSTAAQVFPAAGFGAISYISSPLRAHRRRLARSLLNIWPEVGGGMSSRPAARRGANLLFLAFCAITRRPGNGSGFAWRRQPGLSAICGVAEPGFSRSAALRLGTPSTLRPLRWSLKIGR
jgi:hypothetical protein